MLRAFKFKIKDPPRETLSQWYGTARWVFNTALAHRIRAYEERGETRNYVSDGKLLTKAKAKTKYLWLTEPPTQALQQKLKDLDLAYSGFFGKTKNGKTRKVKTGFPRFKKRGHKESIRIPRNGESLRLENGGIRIPKIKKPLRVWGDLTRLKGTLKSVTISRDSLGDDYISILCEFKHEPMVQRKKKVLGIDLGIKDCVIGCRLEKGKVPDYKTFNLPLIKMEDIDRKIRFFQKKMARQEKDSNSRAKTRHKIAGLHKKIVNIRADYWHKLSRNLASRFSIICVETLMIKNLMKNRRLSRAFSIRGLSTFISMLGYKTEEEGTTLAKADIWFPSSKLCSKCGSKNQGLTLSQRSWRCTCGTVHDRDKNASKNLANIARYLFKEGYLADSEQDYRNKVLA